MHDGLSAIGFWFLVFAPCLPWTIMMWKEHHRKDKQADEEVQPFAKNQWLDAFVIINVALSSYWTFAVVLCSPGIVLLYAFHFDVLDALVGGAGIGAGIVFVSGVSFIWWDSRRRH